MEEKRKYERFDLSLPAEIEVIKQGQESKKTRLSLLTRDISSGGAFFHTLRPLPKGTAVKLNLVLGMAKVRKVKTNLAHLLAVGMVLRTEAEGMAIQFAKDYRFKPYPLTSMD